ncbi:MAG: hypothetical protein M3O82_04535 [Verrucomicrobiota bacterium]|nr:hypothetical protein [Verrucomicrobiota bacterium]
MKILTLIAAIALVYGTESLLARPGRDGVRSGHKLLADLGPADREKLKAARENAMKDPKVQAAFEDMRATAKESHETLHAALLKVDPSLQPILDKLKASRMERRKGGTADEIDGVDKPAAGGVAANLTPEERAKLQAATQKVRSEPDVKATHARTQQARQVFRAALRAAILAADPSLAPLLNQMQAKRGGADLEL